MRLKARQRSVHLISLGCDKNLADSEKTLGLLTDAGYVYTDDAAQADVIVVNTCCFIRDAKTESVETLLRMTDLKAERKQRGGRPPVLVVMGCMAERYKEEITESLPEVDVLVGTNSWQDIVSVLDRHTGNTATTCEFRQISENAFTSHPVTRRMITAGGHFSYLKIAEGCGKNCTYCIIPSLKGKYRSVPMEDLVTEAEELAAAGVKELILVAQETTLYGTDLYGKKRLPELLERLNAIDGIEWIRLLYCYPEEITEELISAIKRLPKVCHYIDMPIQHASNHILRRMARAATQEELRRLIGHLREEIPDVVLRTTLISGFPGETDADHQILCQFVREMEFDRLGDFEYSREEGTKAAAYSHQVAARTKAGRRDEIMTIQQELAERKARIRVGKVYRVMIEGRLTEEALEAESDAGTMPVWSGAAASDRIGSAPHQTAGVQERHNIYVGRTYMDAPDVDGLIYLDTGRREFLTGDMVDARVTGAAGYDLIGELV